MFISRTLMLMSVSLIAVIGLAEPQVVEYTRDGIDYVATIFTDTAAKETFIVPANVTSLDYLIVGGGGGGGSGVNSARDNKHGGGGGAGGLVEGSVDVTAGSVLSVTVGAGGTGGTDGAATDTQAQNGGESSIAVQEGEVIASALGGGAGGDAYCNGKTGACGGGGGRSGTGAAGSLGGQGSNGGSTNSGGGGGMGGRASETTNYEGGPGVTSSITGTEVTYAAGGCGAGNNHTKNNPGAEATGNGGDGGRLIAGNKGGSGIVVIRYAKVEAGQQVNTWTVEPSLAATVFAAGEGTAVNLGEAKSGATVSATYTEEELKALPKGSYTMTFSVAESESWTALVKSVPFFVRSMSFPAPGDPDDAATTYTWNGGEGYWCDLTKWTSDPTPAFGYPNDTVLASAVIATEATIKADPDGETFGPAAVNKLTITAPATLKDGSFDVAGTLTATADLRLENVALTAAAKNQLLLLTGNATIANTTLSGSDAILYAYGDGKTVVEEGAAGTNTLRNVRVGYYDKILSTGTRYVVKNGPGFKPAGVNVGNAGAKDIRFVIDNTEVTVNVSATIFQVVAGAENSFVEFAGEQAKLTVAKGVLTAGTEDGADQTSGLLFRLPETPYAAAPVVKKAGAGSGQLNLYANAVLALDVTNVKKTGVYPLVEDARGSFAVGIAAAGGDVAAYLAQLQKNVKVVQMVDGVEKPADASRVTLILEGSVLSAKVTGPQGLVLFVR